MSQSGHESSSSDANKDFEMLDVVKALSSIDRTPRARMSQSSRAIARGSNVRVTKSRLSRAVAKDPNARVDLANRRKQSLVVKMAEPKPFNLAAKTPAEKDSSVDIEAERAKFQAVSDAHKAACEASVRCSELRVLSAQDLQAVDNEIKKLQRGIDLASWHGLGLGYASTLVELLSDNGKFGALLTAMRAEHRRETSQTAALTALKHVYDEKKVKSDDLPMTFANKLGDPELHSEETVQAALVLVGMKNAQGW